MFLRFWRRFMKEPTQSVLFPGSIFRTLRCDTGDNKRFFSDSLLLISFSFYFKIPQKRVSYEPPNTIVIIWAKHFQWWFAFRSRFISEPRNFSIDTSCCIDIGSGRVAVVSIDAMLRSKATKIEISGMPKVHFNHHNAVLLCCHRIGYGHFDVLRYSDRVLKRLLWFSVCRSLR